MPENSKFRYNSTPLADERALKLRRRMTKVEKILWEVLRRKNLKGFYFRRQHPIGIYIADFYCDTAKLVVEVDGPSHDALERKRKDEERDRKMKELGLKILRFKSEDVLQNLDKVVHEIEKHLDQILTIEFVTSLDKSI